MIFKNRKEAGEKLAQKLGKYRKPIVLAIPRGGVVLGAEIAKKLGAPLDIIVARKLGAPWSPELAIGAVTAGGEMNLDEGLIERIGVDYEFILKEQGEQMKEAARREELYRDNRPKPNLKGKTVVLVDDGLATGATMESAVRSAKASDASEIIVAVPVAPRDTAAHFEKIVDKVVVLYVPEIFKAIGEFYSDFLQVSDEQVIEILKEYSTNTNYRKGG